LFALGCKPTNGGIGCGARLAVIERESAPFSVVEKSIASVHGPFPLIPESDAVELLSTGHADEAGTGRVLV